MSPYFSYTEAHMVTYQIVLSEAQLQTQSTLSHAGGHPVLPPQLGLPHCGLCDTPMTFFFQLQFPATHPWHPWVMAFFQCTHCWSDDYCVPKAFYGKDVVVPEGHLDAYQKNFRVVVFEATEPVEIRLDHEAILQYQPLTLEKSKRKSRTPRIGGEPNWFIQDETPASYMGQPFTFLMQTGEDWTFRSVPDAPRQKTMMGYRREGHYMIFSGLPLYFYGCVVEDRPKVYVFNQK